MIRQTREFDYSNQCLTDYREQLFFTFFSVPFKLRYVLTMCLISTGALRHTPLSMYGCGKFNPLPKKSYPLIQVQALF